MRELIYKEKLINKINFNFPLVVRKKIRNEFEEEEIRKRVPGVKYDFPAWSGFLGMSIDKLKEFYKRCEEYERISIRRNYSNGNDSC